MEVKLEDLARKKRELKTDFTNTRRNLTVESTNEVPNRDDVKAWRSHLTTVYDETKKVIMEYMEAVVVTDSRRHAGLQKQYKQLEGQYSDAMELARSVLIRSSRASLAASTRQTPSPKQSPLRGATPLLASVREESREILDLRAALQNAPFLGRQHDARVMLPRAADYGERVKVEPDSRVVMFSGQRVGEPAEPFPTVAMATASAHAPPQTDMINSNACTALSAAAAEYQPRSSVLPASFATMTTGSNAPAIIQEQGFLIHDPADQTPSMMYATYGNNSARPQQAYMYQQQQQQPQWSASNSAVMYNSPVSTGPSHTISTGASQYGARPSAGMQAPRAAVFAPVPTYVGGTAARPAPRTAPAAAAQINIASKLKRIEIAVFIGEKRKYERWKSAFSVCVDQQPLSAEFKLLQLRQYVAGEALDAIESLGYSAAAYDAALRRLERRFGGSRRRLVVRTEELERSPPIRAGRDQDLERFTDVLDMAVVTLKDSGMHTDLGTGILYQRIQQKLPVNLLARYRHWIVHHQKDESVEVLLEWLNAEPEVLAATTETIEGISQQHHVRSQLSTSGTSRNQPTRTATAHDAVQPRTATFVTATNTAGNVPTARSKCCNGGGHPIWRCPEFEKQTVSQRWAAAKRSKSCYRCLATGHRGKDCPRDRECGIDGCTQHHHRLLHSEPRQPPPSSLTHASGETGAMQPENFSAVSLGNSTKGEENRVRTVTSIRTVPFQLSNGKRSLTVNALLDDASTRSYIASNVTAELGLIGSSMSLTISKLNGQQETIHTVPVSCTLRSVDGATSTTLHAGTIEQPTGNMEVVDWHHLGKQYAHLANVEFPPLPSKRHIDVLIGADYPELHMAYEERSGNSHEPVARRTALGWTYIGQVQPAHPAASCCFTMFSDGDLQSSLKRLWEIEEVNSSTTKFMSRDDKVAEQKVAASLKVTDGRYCVGIPWKSERPVMPESRAKALGRLHSLEKRLRRDSAAATAYSDVIRKYLANGNGVALNDVISAGPKLQQSLPKVLLRFRQNKVAIICDIQEMYLQISLAPEDRPFHRFLWRNNEQEPAKYEFNRVVFGVNASPFLAQYAARHNAHQHADNYPHAAETVLESTYMDDSMDSVRSDEEGVELVRQLSALWHKASMHPRKWLRTSTAVLQTIPEEDRAEEINLTKGELPNVKILGVLWLAKEDQFTFQLQLSEIGSNPTKRAFLSAPASLFDPLGLLAPYLVQAKVLLQEMWLCGAAWDEQLPPAIVKKVLGWLEQVTELSTVRVPRCLTATGRTAISSQLHVFSDASEVAYGAVAYLVSHYDTGESTARFVASKVCVAPVTAVSVPRLELMAATTGATIATSSAESLNLDPEQRRYGRTAAMFCTGSPTTAAPSSSLWLVEWARFNGKPILPSGGTCPPRSIQPTWSLEELPPAQREFDELSPPAIRDSEEFFIKRAQQQSLPEYAAVKAGKPIPATSKLVSLKPMIDNAGLLRVGGRLQHADFLTAEQRNPIVLPRGDHVTQLIVKACHERGYHAFGVSRTLAELSSRYWIVAGREEVRAWKAKCARCARNRTKPAMQVMAPLPKVRVSLPLRAFGRVSVDYAGPFMTKQGHGKTQHKRYLCLFTCLQTRAVHLELSYALTTDSFLQAYVRFTNRRGVPIDVISDNGTNFVGATNELAQLVKQLDAEAIQRQTVDQQTSWRFNPPAAPHFGGVAWGVSEIGKACYLGDSEERGGHRRGAIVCYRRRGGAHELTATVLRVGRWS
ncbi:uncharacterized protein LOC135827076 [Sycon ciliatum]|uniref:uncharacterized protein LOC135827076 n=1 Tax=Sycon ciliatum TaxID=27933 RepID=UPI0031F6B957